MGEGPTRRFRSVLLALVLAVAVSGAVSAAASADRIVYVSNGFPAGSNDISALRINPDGTLTPITGSPFATGGTITEGLGVTPDAQHLYVATFSGEVRGFNIAAGGGLSVTPGSPYPTGSTPLGVAPSPDSKTLFNWNHGGSIGVWTIAADGSLSQITSSPFNVATGYTNPFAGSVAPDGSHLYLPNENTNPGGGAPDTVSAYSLAANGAPTNIQNAVAGGPAGADGNPFGSGITPDGKFVYVSAPEDNASVGDIYGYSVGADGKLTAVPGSPFANTPGSHPLNIAISPDGKHLYVATRASNTVNAYNIAANGSLSAIAGSPFATGGTNGKALALTPDGRRLYVSNNVSNNVSGFNVGADGSLTTIPGSPWPTGGVNPDLESLAITPNQPPSASFAAQAATQNQASAFNATASSDSDGTIATYDWDFGDGTTLLNGGPTPAHVYTQPGTYLASVRLTDNEDCSTQRIFTGKATLCNGSAVAETARTLTVTATSPSNPSSTPASPQPALPTLPPDITGPAIGNGSVEPSSFAVDPRGRREASAAVVAKGTTIRYTLSEAARVVFSVDSKTTGRSVSGTCKRKTRRNRKRRKCTLMVRQGTFAKQSGQGANIKRFSGRLASRTLRPGSYQLTLDATDNAGNRAQPVVMTFKVVPR